MTDQTFVIATMDTEHFNFLAVGRNEDEAKAGIYKAMAAHSEQTQSDPDGGAWGESSRQYNDDPPAYDFPAWAEYYGVNVTDPLACGEGARDYSRLTSAG